MAWKQISECLPAELTARMKMEKAGAAKAPASITGQRRVEGDDIVDTASSGVEVRPALPSGRWERTAVPERDAPSLAVRCHLRLVIGGRTEAGGNTSVRPMLKPYRGDGRAILRLVSG